MYAIIAESGKQFKVEEGQELRVDYRDAHAGDSVTFDQVLAVSDGEGSTQFGSPTLDGASVEAEVVGVKQGQKLTVRKFRRRKNSKTRTGHRQLYTMVKINKISS